MLAAMQLIAVLSCTLFTGAAIYINLVEHPARMACDTKTAVTVWALSYKRATPMQASLAIMGCVAGVAVWVMSGPMRWLWGAILLGSVIPFTFIAVMPTNHRLLEPGRDLSSAETRALLERWGRLHAVRSALSFAASVVFLSLMVGH
jgi:hypothetical protein